jgi:hypothetical protein
MFIFIRIFTNMDDTMTQTSHHTFFKSLFIASAIWNLIGTLFGYFNTELTFREFFNRDLTDPLFFIIYQGAWGTTFVYFFGYLIVAFNPIKHTGIVIVGGIGKIGYVISLLKLYATGLADEIVFVVIYGDILFTILFLVYFYQLKKMSYSIL